MNPANAGEEAVVAEAEAKDGLTNAEEARNRSTENGNSTSAERKAVGASKDRVPVVARRDLPGHQTYEVFKTSQVSEKRPMSV